MTTAEVRAGEKFALIALPKTNVADFAMDVFLANDVVVTRQMPFPVADHWQCWIGEVRVEQLQKAGCYILAKIPTNTPGILDGENEILMRRVCQVYDGLLIVEAPLCATPPFLLTGAHINGDISIRKISDLQMPVRCTFTESGILGKFDEADLHRASALGDALATLVASSDHRRLKLALSAYLAGIHDRRPDERLHQFCRCIDGFICSRKGKGEADFVERSALFIGSGQDTSIRETYRMRNAVEHLRLAEDEAADCVDLRSQRLRVIERCVQVEEIARYCLQRVLLSSDLIAICKDESSLDQFWRCSEDARRKTWGAPLDINNCLAMLIDSRYVTDDDLGLN